MEELCLLSCEKIKITTSKTSLLAGGAWSQDDADALMMVPPNVTCTFNFFVCVCVLCSC